MIEHVLIASPVRQSSEVLQLFLKSIERLDTEGMVVDFLFVDDNTETSEDLISFRIRNPNTLIWSNKDKRPSYPRTETTHEWSDDLVWRVAAMKDDILCHMEDMAYDYLFLIDSDVLVPPDTIKRLIQTKKDIISNIYWTSWQPNTKEMPQVWVQDSYTMSEEFIGKLKVPGIYEVGGLGACTLIRLKAINMGASFERIHNVSFWGEDRHFCIRAVALGLSLHVDTNNPGFHIYRQSDLPKAEEYLLKTNKRN